MLVRLEVLEALLVLNGGILVYSERMSAFATAVGLFSGKLNYHLFSSPAEATCYCDMASMSLARPSLFDCTTLRLAATSRPPSRSMPVCLYGMSWLTHITHLILFSPAV